MIGLPVFDWSKAARWHKWAAMDAGGLWWVFKEKPEIRSSCWMSYNADLIPSDYAPKWTGDWKQSLVERPTA